MAMAAEGRGGWAWRLLVVGLLVAPAAHAQSHLDTVGLAMDGVTDDTAALTAACSTVRQRVALRPGTMRISGPIVCSTPGVEIVGVGPGTTEIHQTNPVADVFVLDEAYALGGGISSLSISGPAPFYNAPGGRGAAISVSRCNEGFAVRNVHIRNMDVGIKRESCFSDRYTGLDIRYFSDVAIWTPAIAQGDPTNDGRFSDIKIQNIAFVKADGATSRVRSHLMTCGGHEVAGWLDHRSG